MIKNTSPSCNRSLGAGFEARLEERVDESLHKKHAASKIEDAKRPQPEPKPMNFSDGSLVSQWGCKGESTDAS